MPRPRTRSNNLGGLNDANSNLARFTDNLRLVNREAGAGWRLQQKENREREGLISGLAKYRARSALLSGVVGAASAIGTGFSDAIRFGGGDTAGGLIRSDSVRFSMMNLLADHFDVGGIFSQVQQPIRRAAERTGDITSRIAQAGGKVTPELRQGLANIFLPSEQRAEEERRQVSALFTSKEVTGEALQGSKFGELIDKLAVGIDNLNSAISSLRAKLGF